MQDYQVALPLDLQVSVKVVGSSLHRGFLENEGLERRSSSSSGSRGILIVSTVMCGQTALMDVALVLSLLKH